MHEVQSRPYNHNLFRSGSHNIKLTVKVSESSSLSLLLLSLLLALLPISSTETKAIEPETSNRIFGLSALSEDWLILS